MSDCESAMLCLYLIHHFLPVKSISSAAVPPELHEAPHVQLPNPLSITIHSTGEDIPEHRNGYAYQGPFVGTGTSHR